MIQIKLFTTLLLSSVLLVQSKNQIPFKAQSMQNSNSNSNPFASSNSLPTLADILTVERTASIFFSYLRETSLSPLLSSTTTFPIVFVPQDSAIALLARKPHSGPPPPTTTETEIGISSAREEEEIKRKYLEKWLQRHVALTAGDWNGEGDDEKAEWESMIEGKYIQATKQGNDWILSPSGKETKVVKVIEGSNGRVVIIAGLLNVEDL